MTVCRFRPALAAGRLALLAALGLGDTAAQAGTVAAQAAETPAQRLERRQDARVGEALRDFKNRRTQDLASARDRMDGCWAELSRMPRAPIEPAEDKAFYCVAYALAARLVDTGVARMEGAAPTPGLDKATVNGRIREALITVGYSESVAQALSDIIAVRTIDAFGRKPRK